MESNVLAKTLDKVELPLHYSPEFGHYTYYENVLYYYKTGRKLPKKGIRCMRENCLPNRKKKVKRISVIFDGENLLLIDSEVKNTRLTRGKFRGLSHEEVLNGG